MKQRVAVVTGASREIGAAMAARFARAGVAVVLNHYAEPSLAEQQVAQIRAAGGTVVVHEADLSQVEANQALVARAVAEFGRLDYFLANAGITIHRRFLETDEQAWDTLVDLNLKGSYFGAQAAARQMIRQGDGGRIIFSSSVTGVKAIPELGAYGITKAGLRHMASVIAVELASYGITVNALAIGATLNERNQRDNPQYAQDWAGVIPIGRCGTPEDVADVAYLLASPESVMVTGQTIVLDGGWSLLGRLP